MNSRRQNRPRTGHTFCDGSLLDKHLSADKESKQTGILLTSEDRYANLSDGFRLTKLIFIGVQNSTQAKTITTEI